MAAMPLAAVSAHNVRMLLLTRAQLQGMAAVEGMLRGALPVERQSHGHLLLHASQLQKHSAIACVTAQRLSLPLMQGPTLPHPASPAAWCGCDLEAPIV